MLFDRLRLAVQSTYVSHTLAENQMIARRNRLLTLLTPLTWQINVVWYPITTSLRKMAKNDFIVHFLLIVKS